jgi:GNAT superfamily N-acetyltransferase
MANIRQYQTADRDRCRALWAELTEYHREIYDDPTIGGENPGLEFDEHLKKAGPERIWVATDQDKIVGFTSLIINGEEAEIEPVIVCRDCRGKGLGRQLVDYVVKQAQQVGVLCLSVKPVTRNRAALAFFHRTGFRTLGHLQLFRWLGPATPGQWRAGVEIFGKKFEY